MPPHSKTTTSAVSPGRGRPRPTSDPDSPNGGTSSDSASPQRVSRDQLLPPRAAKGHPPRPPTTPTKPRREVSSKLQSTTTTTALRSHLHDQQQQQQQNIRHPQQQSLHQQDLRKAYHAQSKKKISIRHSGSSSSSNHFVTDNDHCSMSSMSAANSGTTPSSVYMPSEPLFRDVSDLSGLSGATRASSVPGQIYDPKTFQKPWRQAYCLSSRFLPNDRINDANSKQTNNDRGPSIWVAQNDVVEIFDNLQSALGRGGATASQSSPTQHNRIPVILLLMDPHHHCYELMQIWVDRAMDSVRDLIQAMQNNLCQDQHHHQQQQRHAPTSALWKQTYDGIFQVRGHRFTQLINIIRLVKYDIHPHEVLVAKPWSMTAKVTTAFAGTVIRHLRSIGVITPPDASAKTGLTEDAPLLLSKKAKERAYFPNGILNHHHAVQFVSFAPPFEKAVTITNANGLPSPHSQDDALSSLGSVSGDRHDVTGNVLTSLIAVPRKAGGRNTKVQSQQSVVDLDKIPSPSPQQSTHQTSRQNAPSESKKVPDKPLPKKRGFFSKLNCCRSKSDPASNATTMKGDSDSISMTPGFRVPAKNIQMHNDTSVTLLSEEEELQWLAYSMQPIAEDQSLASGSIISMSAPLLKAPPADRTTLNDESGSLPSTAGGFPQPIKAYGGRDMFEF